MLTMDWSRLLGKHCKRKTNADTCALKTTLIPQYLFINRSNIGKEVKEHVGVLWSGSESWFNFRVRVMIRVSFLSRPIHCKHLSLIESTTASVTKPDCCPLHSGPIDLSDCLRVTSAKHSPYLSSYMVQLNNQSIYLINEVGTKL